MVAKSEKIGGGEAAAAVAASPRDRSRRSRSYINKPSWLLCAIADLDDRMEILTRKTTSKEPKSDSFGARANLYYHERPQLLALLQDLYSSYLSLADRHCQVIAKNQQHNCSRSSRCSSPDLKLFDDETIQQVGGGGEVDSDAESSLSFQATPVQGKDVDADMAIAELVMKTVECEIITEELTKVEKKLAESSRKMELQKNLLDVLESERSILLNDNATLGYRVSALVEENKGLAAESLFLKRKAAELARCMLKTREDHGVCMLSRKIEDLQGQIHGLESRNKEYYEKLVKQEEKNKCRVMMKGGDEVSVEDCLSAGTGAGLGKRFSFNLKRVGGGGGADDGSGRVLKLWEKVKKLDLFQCGPQFNSAGS